MQNCHLLKSAVPPRAPRTAEMKERYGGGGGASRD